MVLIGERGWAGVTTRVLAARAGVTPSVVHYHFSSVDALLRQAVLTTMREVATHTRDMLEAVDSPAELVDAMLASVDSYTGADPVSLVFVEATLAANRDHSLRDGIAEVLGDLRTSISALLRRHGVADPVDTAAVLAAVLDGLILHRGLGAGVSGDAAAAVLRRLVTGPAAPGRTDPESVTRA